MTILSFLTAALFTPAGWFVTGISYHHSIALANWENRKDSFSEMMRALDIQERSHPLAAKLPRAQPNQAQARSKPSAAASNTHAYKFPREFMARHREKY